MFHLLEGVFDTGLRAVGQHDLFVGPIVVVGEQDGLAHLVPAQSIQSRLVSAEGEFQSFGDLA